MSAVLLFDAAPGAPVTLRGHVAAVLALIGVMLGMAGLGGGWLAVGAIGLVAVGLAAGLVGTLRQRVAIAAALWFVATAVAAAGLGFGSVGFAVAGSIVFALTCAALGQFAGVLAGVLSSAQPHTVAPESDS
jgi:hypothetical protein